MEKHEDGSVTLTPIEVEEVGSVLTWAQGLYEATRFQQAEVGYTLILGLMAKLSGD